MPFQRNTAPAMKIDVDTVLIQDWIDSNLSDTLKIVTADASGVVRIQAKAGDIRFEDEDNTTLTDTLQITCDAADGGIYQKSSQITDGKIWEIDHGGTISGATATADIDEFNIDLADIVIDDDPGGGANAVTLKAMTVDAGSITATAVGLSTYQAFEITNPTDGEYATERGIQIICDKSVVSNNAIAIETSRDITGVLAAVESFTNYANILGQNVTHSGGDFVLTHDEGILQLNLNHDVTVACTGPDVFSATALDINITGDVNVGTTDARIDWSARAIDIAYTLAETDGVMRMAATDAFRIVVTIPNGLSSAGAFQFDVQEINLDSVVLNDANITFNGLYVDASGLTNTSSAEANLISLVAPDDSNIDQAMWIGCDHGDADLSQIALNISRDLSSAITADRAISNYTVDIGQAANNTSAGDFDLTDAAASGIMRLTLSHTAATTVGVKTDPDICRGTALLIDIDGTTNNANTALDFYPRAIDIAYTLTETSGTLRMAATDIVRITPTIPTGLTSAGAFNFNVELMNLDNVILNDANISFVALNLDASGLTNTASAISRIIDITCPDDSNIDQALMITADTTTSNSTQVLQTSRDINGTVAGAVALTNYSTVLGQAVNHTAGDFIVTQTASTAGILNLNMSHTTSLATTSPDVFASTALQIDIAGTTDTDAGADLDVTARAIDITYTLTETLGVLRMGSTDIFRIAATIPSGLSSAAGFIFDMMELNADSVVLNDANIDFSMNHLDASGITLTAFNEFYAQKIEVPTLSGTAAALAIEENTDDGILQLINTAGNLVNISGDGGTVSRNWLYTNSSIADTTGRTNNMHYVDLQNVTLNHASAIMRGEYVDYSSATLTSFDIADGFVANMPSSSRSVAFNANLRGAGSGRIEEGAYSFGDHFIGRNAHAVWTTRVTTGAVGGAPSTDLNGVLLMRTGAAGAPDEESLDWNDVFDFDNTLRPTLECRIKVVQVDNDTNIAIGLVNANITTDLSQNLGGAANQDFILLQMSHTIYTDTNWHLHCQLDGVSTVDAGAASSTDWVVLRFEFISDTSVEWFINGASQGTIATNIPTDPLQPLLYILSDAAAAKDLEIDYIKYWADKA